MAENGRERHDDGDCKEKRVIGMGKIYVVGIGPGRAEMMTEQAKDVLRTCDVIAGYRTYVDLVRRDYAGREFFSNGMREEAERCRRCIQFAREGKNVALICSGDAGIYGMASPLLEMAEEEGFPDVEIIPGVTAACSGAAVLGAPIGHDCCLISLSDLLTPWEKIEKRLVCAAEGDFCIVLYNPGSRKRSSHLRKACEILLTRLKPETPCGYVRNIGREGTEKKICTLGELSRDEMDMFTTVFIGSSGTYAAEGRMITPRGYCL